MSYFDHDDNSSTLNELDNAMEDVILNLMKTVDTRRDQSGQKVWNKDNIIMTPTQDIDIVIGGFQLQTGDNFTLPVIAYTPDTTLESVDHTFGNRMNVAGVRVTGRNKKGELVDYGISRLKHVHTKYKVSIWDSDYKSIRFYQDKISLKGVDNEFYFEYVSKILKENKLPFTYLVGLPVLNTIPASTARVKGSGFLYAAGFEIQVWGILADEPVEESEIKQINMGIHIVNDSKELKDWQISVNER